MAITIEAADAYIALNVLDVEDWQAAEDDKKLRLLNVAARTLTSNYADYIIPDNAVYAFAAALAVAYNDTNRLHRQGIQSFSIDGVGSFKFLEGAAPDLIGLIPEDVLELIGVENDVNLSLYARKSYWTVI